MSVLITVLPLLEDIPGFTEQTRSADLGNGYQLVRRDQLTQLDVFDNETFQDEFGRRALLRALSADTYIKTTREMSDPASIAAVADESNKKLDRLLVAFDISQKLWSFTGDIRFSWLEDGSQSYASSRHHWPYSSFDDHPEFADFLRAAELTKTIDIIRSGLDTHYPALKTALDAIQLGSYAFNTSMRFLQEAVALEALCSRSDTEVTHRVAITCAILTGTTPEQRKIIYKEAKRLYGIRSRVIHGSGVRASLEELKQIAQLTRRVLYQVLANDVLPNYETGKSQTEFLVQLALEKV